MLVRTRHCQSDKTAAVVAEGNQVFEPFCQAEEHQRGNKTAGSVVDRDFTTIVYFQSWMGNLKKLVFRCYTYHRSEYLLRFCSHLAQHPKHKLEYVDNWDSTTSLFHKSTGKLLVTFRNENMVRLLC